MDHPSDNTLILPFLTNDPMFARGVEIGMLYEQMKQADMIGSYFQTENQEQITLMANRLGWQIEEMQIWEEGPEWIWIVMREKQ